MRIAFLFILLILPSPIWSQNEDKITELFGISDSSGNYNLIYEQTLPYKIWNVFEGKSINYISKDGSVDSMIVEEDGWWQTGNFGNFTITDYDFYSDNPFSMVYTKSNFYWPDSLINLSNKFKKYILGWGVNRVLIDKSSPNKLYISSNYQYGYGYALSLDSGRTFPHIINSTNEDSTIALIPFNLVSIYPNSDSTMFGIDTLGNLIKSFDAGNNYEIVENSGNWNTLRQNIFYDIDNIHVYGLTEKDSVYYLYVSDNFGNEGSWENILTSEQKISISIDKLNSGSLYVSTNKNIFNSTDFGNTVNLIQTLDYNIVGIYNIANSDTIYAATNYSILELTSSTKKIIKQVYSQELLSYTPLHIGDYWQYSLRKSHIADSEYSTIAYAEYEIIGDTLLENGKKYFHRISTTPKALKIGYLSSKFIRIDSSTGIVYGISEDTTEYVIDDLIASVNDTIDWYVLKDITLQNYLDIQVLTKSYTQATVSMYDFVSFNISQKLGLTKYFYSDAVALDKYQYDLVYAKIDGIEYGNLVDIKNEITINNKFALSQNYPNPFNPTTTINYTIPKESSDFGFQNVELNVYDVLGREVKTLINEKQKSGTYSIQFDGSDLSSGIYFYKLSYGDFVETRKMLLIK